MSWTIRAYVHTASSCICVHTLERIIYLSFVRTSEHMIALHLPNDAVNLEECMLVQVSPELLTVKASKEGTLYMVSSQSNPKCTSAWEQEPEARGTRVSQVLIVGKIEVLSSRYRRPRLNSGVSGAVRKAQPQSASSTTSSFIRITRSPLQHHPQCLQAVSQLGLPE